MYLIILEPFIQTSFQLSMLLLNEAKKLWLELTGYSESFDFNKIYKMVEIPIFRSEYLMGITQFLPNASLFVKKLHYLLKQCIQVHPFPNFLKQKWIKISTCCYSYSLLKPKQECGQEKYNPQIPPAYLRLITTQVPFMETPRLSPKS